MKKIFIILSILALVESINANGPMRLNQGPNPWTAPAVTEAGDIYMAVAGGHIYKQTGGSGNFISTIDSVFTCGGMTAYGNDLYITTDNGPIYKYSGGTFTDLGFPHLAWQGVTVTASGVYAAVSSGDIYYKANGGSVIALGQTSRLYRGMASHGDTVRVVVYWGGIYQQIGGSGDFAALPDVARNYNGIAFSPDGNWYVTDYSGDIYEQTWGVGLFAATGQYHKGWCGIASTADSFLYISALADDIYKWKPSSAVTPKPDYVFLIAGQSNMTGVDGGNGTSSCSSSVFLWAEGGWQHWVDPYGTNGTTMFPQLGNYLRAHLDGTKSYGFIPEAVGAAGVIDYWSKPNNSTFHQAVWAANQVGPIDGIIFMAGEADQWSDYSKAAYKTAFKSMVKNFRDSCTGTTTPIPFYFIETHIKVGDSLIIGGIKAAQHECDDPGNKVFLSATTTCLNRIDDYHLSRYSQDTMGQRVGNTILYNYGLSTYYRGPRFNSYQIGKDSNKVFINLKPQSVSMLPKNPTGFLVMGGSVKATIASDTMIGRTIKLNLSAKLTGSIKVGYLAENIPNLSGKIYFDDALKSPAEGFYFDLPIVDNLIRTVYAPITINAIKIGETNAHFPYTIDLSRLDTVWWNQVIDRGNIYVKTNAGTSVPRVVDSIDFPARLGYLTFDASVSTSENTIYKVYASLGSGQTNSSDVFTASNCIIRHSLNGSASPLVDDCGNYNLVITGGTPGQSGKIGAALQQTAAGNVGRTSDIVSEMSGARYCTVSMLVYVSDLSAYSFYFGRETGDNEMSIMQYPGYGLQAKGAGTTGLLGRFYAYPFTLNTWYHLTVVHNGDGLTNADQLKIIINGAQKTITEWGGTFSPTFVANSGRMDYGNFSAFGAGLVGKMDEIRQFIDAKSAGWALTEYNMYFDAGSVTVGATVDETTPAGNNFGALIIGFSFAAVVGVGALFKRARKKY